MSLVPLYSFIHGVNVVVPEPPQIKIAAQFDVAVEAIFSLRPFPSLAQSLRATAADEGVSGVRLEGDQHD